MDSTSSTKYQLKNSEDYITHEISKCPTQKCEDCTGSISNSVFRHRFLCICSCHNRESGFKITQPGEMT